ncbi:MAG TPA: ABC transporter ATP-binding protein, partial [Lachnospiraceae bacterium]|nr:ABC transporter ATP-binding protein [Lachnospiraceae bacterium]
LAVSGIVALAQWVMNILNNRTAYCVVRDIRNEAFKKIEILPLRYLDAHSQGEIVSRVIADVDQFADGLLMGFTQLFTGVVTILGTLGFMLFLNVKITLVVVIITPLSLFAARFIAKKTFRMFREQSEIRGEQTAFVDEMIGNEKVVKAFSQEEKMLAKFDEINQKLQKASLYAIFFSSLTNPVTRFVNGVVYAGVALTGAMAVLSGKMTVGVLTCFLSYANQYTKPFNEISGVVTELQNAIACAERIFELIEEEPCKFEAENAEVLADVGGRVVCEHVDFSYTADSPLLSDMNISVQPGERVAIVGPTGCGKTTLINLLMRFYDADSGSIRVDGTDIKNVTLHSLRTSYGMVLQDTWLRNGTVRENIIMGKLNAAEEEIIAAAKEAHAHSFIRRLPDGYDTVIGEDGGMLSQGQKQLLCITRVMLCLPPMLILDEATSSIDTRTEVKIQSAFQKLMKGKTSFIVAHRLSTIRNADMILVMKNGRIIEQGTHEALLEQNGFYNELYNSQYS